MLKTPHMENIEHGEFELVFSTRSFTPTRVGRCYTCNWRIKENINFTRVQTLCANIGSCLEDMSTFPFLKSLFHMGIVTIVKENYVRYAHVQMLRLFDWI